MKNIAFCSFGKDSLAQIIIANENGIKFDEVVYCDIRFSQDISGEHPAMAEWIPTAEKILKNEFNITVKHLTANVTFEEQFYKVKEKGNHIGDNYGFPYIVGAWCNSRLKLEVISKYIKSINDSVCEYVGIAYDEPKRYERLSNKATDKVIYRSLLYERKITEQQAFKICRPFNLVSPVYSLGCYRGGCWFCVKQCLADLYDLFKFYPNYYNKLLVMEKDSHNTFKPNITLEKLKFKFENGFIPKRRKIQSGIEQLNFFNLI